MACTSSEYSTSDTSSLSTQSSCGCSLDIWKLDERAAQVDEHRRQVSRKSRSGRAVDHAVNVRQRQRLDQPRHELLAVPNRPERGPAGSNNGNLERVDDRREVRPADAAQSSKR